MNDFMKSSYISLLQEDNVGTVKSPSYRLPEADFTYGRFVPKDKEGAGEVVRTWVVHTPSKAKPKRSDFRRLNKMSVSNGFYESKGLSDFRKSHTAFQKVKVGQKALKIILPEEEFYYGYPNKPSTPINSVLSNEYGTRSAMVTQELYKSRLYETQNRSFLLPKLTNSTRVSKERAMKKIDELNNTEQKALWKIRKFQTISPKVETINKNYIMSRSPQSISISNRPVL